MARTTNRNRATLKSLTLHALDDQLADQIRRRAEEMSLSMNELAKRILAEGLGIKTPAKPPHKEDFACFCGTWNERDLKAFNQRVADLEIVDAEDWP